MCSNPASGLPFTALNAGGETLFNTRRRAGFFGLSFVAVGMRETMSRPGTMTIPEAHQTPG
jgi:hypothetical protein